MEYRVLGSLEVLDGDRSVPLAGAKQRALLALLLVHANHVLSRDRLVDELWGDEPPDGAVQNVHVYVSRLRKLLSSDTLLTRPPGYLLEVEPGELDLHSFELLLADGREALGRGDPTRASRVLREALALWRGPALAEFAFEPFAQAEIGRLEDLRLAAVEERLEADLALGRHADLIGELEALIAENPYRERLRGQLMRALYRSGRQAEALDAYRDARSALVDQLGIEPSAELQQLEKAILTQDTELDSRVVTERPRGTVTFLFTDVEGSTRLLKQLRDEYGNWLGEHQRLLREAFAAHGGEEVDTQGDAFFCVFSRARDAAAAAIDGQRALTSYSWPEGAEFRVRIGMHTGEPVLSDEGRYHGMGVHRTARIMAAGHGGQVLASQATASLLADDELPGVTLRDLGEHGLKDMDRPERIFQLEVDDLPGTFPPLRTDAVSRAAEDLAAPERRPIYRRPLVIGALAGVIAAAIAIPVFALGGDGSLKGLEPNTIGAIDGERIASQDQLSGAPSAMTSGGGVVWIASETAGTVSRFDPRSGAIETLPVGGAPGGVAEGAGWLWLTSREGRALVQINPKTLAHVQTVTVGNGPGGVAVGKTAVWVANTIDGTLSRFDLSSGSVTNTIPVGPDPAGVAVGPDAVWVALEETGTVVRVDPVSRSIVEAVHVGNGPSAVAIGAGAVWVANRRDGTVTRIDPATNSVTATVTVGDDPSAIVAEPNAVWVASSGSGWISRIDPTTREVTKRLSVGSRPIALVEADAKIYAATVVPLSGHRGGVLRVESDPSLCRCVDPTQILADQTSLYVAALLYDGLVAYRRAAGIAGAKLVPDLALLLPRPTNGGRTYTFQLRHGLHYSDGSEVRASDFRSSIERALTVYPDSALNGIAGATLCRSGPRCDLSKGIQVDDAARTITIRLARPDPEFLYKLALAEASVVPARTPLHPAGNRPVLGTGPYRIASFDRRTVRLVRNEHFRVWSAEARPDGYVDEIRLHLAADVRPGIRSVERGAADVVSLAFRGVTLEEQRGVFTRDAGRFHTDAQPATYWEFFNTRVPPFDDLRVRRALNFAVDRHELIGLAGGLDAITCQVLPPDLRGYRPYCPYTRAPNGAGTWSAPDLTKARSLVAASQTAGTRIVVTTPKAAVPLGISRYFVSLLRRLGYQASLRVIPKEKYNLYVADSRHKVQIGFSGWGADSPVASNFVEPIMTCASFVPKSTSNPNFAGYCNPAIDAKVKHAASLQASEPERADELWAGIDRELVDQAVTMPWSTPRGRVLVSTRVGNYQSHVEWGTLLDQLWVK